MHGTDAQCFKSGIKNSKTSAFTKDHARHRETTRFACRETRVLCSITGRGMIECHTHRACQNEPCGKCFAKRLEWCTSRMFLWIGLELDLILLFSNASAQFFDVIIFYVCFLSILLR